MIVSRLLQQYIPDGCELKPWTGDNYVFFGSGPSVCVVCAEALIIFCVGLYDESGISFLCR